MEGKEPKEEGWVKWARTDREQELMILSSIAGADENHRCKTAFSFCFAEKIKIAAQLRFVQSRVRGGVLSGDRVVVMAAGLKRTSPDVVLGAVCGSSCPNSSL